MLYVQDYGAVGNGIADDTAAIQAAINALANQNRSGSIALPAGTYRVTDTLTYRGNSPYGIRLLGDVGAAGPTGSVIRWDGPVGGTVLSLMGANETTVEHLAIDGNQKAVCAIAMGYDGTRDVPACDITLNGLVLGGVLGVNSACVRIGMMPDGITADTRQCNHILINRCAIIGSGANGTTQYGIITGTANVKNFAIRDCKVGGFQTGIYHGGAGFMLIDGVEAYGNVNSDVVGFNEAVVIRALESEGSGRLFYGLMSGNPASVSIESCLWYSSATAADDMVVVHGGSINIRSSHLYNNRVPGALPKIAVFVHPTSCPTFDSYGNYYQNAAGKIPAVDLSGQDLTATPSPYPALPPLVRSFGDYGAAPPNLTYLTPITP